MDDFPGNSRKQIENTSEPEKIAEHKIEPVITGTVLRRKKSFGRRLRETFFAGDTNSVFGYLMRDVLIPALQATATDLVKQGIEKAVYGEVRSPHTMGRSGYSTSRNSHISYDRYGSSTSRPTAPARTPTTPSDRRESNPSAYQLGEIVVTTRPEADAITDGMYDVLKEYGAVTVADLRQLLNETPQFTDNKFGWDDLRGLRIARVREGYAIVLPDPRDMLR